MAQSSKQRFNRILRWLIPNGGTLLIVALLLLTQSLWARPFRAPANAPGASATTVNYQGRLGDNAGAPLDGTYGMTFALYDEATGGNLIWGPEEHTAVPVSDGLFSVGLGSKTQDGIPTTTWNGDRYLEITVGGETLSPRELIRSVPIAGMALNVPDGAISSRNLAPAVFNVYSSGEVSVGSESTEVLALNVDFPLDATYVIFVKVTAKYDESTGSNSRISSYLADENGDVIPGSSMHTYHSEQGIGGTQTGSLTIVHNFSAGSHTISLKTAACNYGSGAVRAAHIIAIPFTQTP